MARVTFSSLRAEYPADGCNLQARKKTAQIRAAHSL